MSERPLPDVALRPLADSDLALMADWLAEPHLHPFYVKATPPTPQAVVDQYRECCGTGPTCGVIASIGDRPYGYMQWYLNRSWPEWGYTTIERPEGVSIDYFIGDPARRGKGLGRAMLVALTQKIFDEVAPRDRRIYIGHNSMNRPAIRCTLGAGFAEDGEFTDEGTACNLFVKTAETATASAPAGSAPAPGA